MPEVPAKVLWWGEACYRDDEAREIPGVGGGDGEEVRVRTLSDGLRDERPRLPLRRFTPGKEFAGRVSAPGTARAETTVAP